MVVRYIDYITPIILLYIFRGIYKGFYGEKNWYSVIPNKTELWVFTIPFAVWYILAYKFDITLGNTNISEPHDEPQLVGMVSAGALFIQSLANKYINKKVGFITAFIAVFLFFWFVYIIGGINDIRKMHPDYFCLAFMVYLLYIFPLVLTQLFVFILNFILKFLSKRFKGFVLFNSSSDFLLTFLPLLFWFVTANIYPVSKSISNFIEPFFIGIGGSLFLVIKSFLNKYFPGNLINHAAIVLTCILAIVIAIFTPCLPE